MSPGSLADKLRIQSGDSVALIAPPPGIVQQLQPLPENTTVTDEPAMEADVVLLFVYNQASLAQWAQPAINAVGEQGILWVAYPKRSGSLTTDLSRDRGWAPLAQAGYTAVAQIAIDKDWSALRFRPAQSGGDAARIDAQYAGDRAALRPIYEQIVQHVQQMGSDIALAPRKSYVAFVRGKQFALVRPTRRGEVHLAFKFNTVPDDDRLQPGAGVGSGSMTHKVVLRRAEDVDAGILALLQEAYRQAGG